MRSADPGWDWFDPSRGRDPVAADPSETDANELARAFARCFRGAEGRAVIRHLRAITLDRALGPDAPDAALRHAEGQRQLVAYMTALVRRGGGAGVPPTPDLEHQTEETDRDRSDP